MGAFAILEPAVAGTWYPSGRNDLASLVDRLLDEATSRATGAGKGTVAVVVPHAGFAYSGAVAASAFRLLSGASPSRVVILGPSHYFGFRGAAIPSGLSGQKTPLGVVPFDLPALDALRASPVVRSDDRAFAPEHALEAEMPFLQRVLDAEIPLVPVLLGGGATHAEAVRLASDLQPLVDARTAIVVSSDFTHYGERFGYVPFRDEIPRRLRDLDLGAVTTIVSGDGPAFAGYVDETGATICGRRAIDVLLALRPGGSSGALIEYDASGRITGEWEHSVSYASIAFPPSESRP